VTAGVITSSPLFIGFLIFSDLRAESAIRMAEEPELTKVVFETPRYWDNFSLNSLALGPNPHHPFRRESTMEVISFSSKTAPA